MTTAHTFAAGEMIFDEDGNVYEFVAHIDGVGTVANCWYECHDDDGAPYDRIGGPTIIKGPIFPEAPALKRSTEISQLDEKITAKRTELRLLEDQLRETNAARAASLKRIKENDALRRIDAFLAGEITHYVICGESSQMDIVAVGEAVAQYSSRGELRLLSLTASMSSSWQSKEAVIRWDLNRYSDGSGHNTACIPCTSLDEARAVLAEKVAERFALWESGKEKNYISYTVSAARKHGLPIPKSYLDQEADLEKKYAEKMVSDAEAQLSKARKALADATQKMEAA